MIDAIGWLSAFATLLTGLAMLQDMLRTPRKTDPMSISGLLVFYPSLRTATLWEVMLRVCLACFLARATPHPWFEYVFTDRFRRKTPTSLPSL